MILNRKRKEDIKMRAVNKKGRYKARKKYAGKETEMKLVLAYRTLAL